MVAIPKKPRIIEPAGASTDGAATVAPVGLAWPLSAATGEAASTPPWATRTLEAAEERQAETVGARVSVPEVRQERLKSVDVVVVWRVLVLGSLEDLGPERRVADFGLEAGMISGVHLSVDRQPLASHVLVDGRFVGGGGAGRDQREGHEGEDRERDATGNPRATTRRTLLATRDAGS